MSTPSTGPRGVAACGRLAPRGCGAAWMTAAAAGGGTGSSLRRCFRSSPPGSSASASRYKKRGGPKAAPIVCLSFALELQAGAHREVAAQRLVGRRIGVAAVERGRTDGRTDDRRILVEDVHHGHRQVEILGDAEAKREIEPVVGRDVAEIDGLAGQRTRRDGALERDD